jgi:hypothetical protein
MLLQRKFLKFIHIYNFLIILRLLMQCTRKAVLDHCSFYINYISLKGHGNEINFLIFLYQSVWYRSLIQLYSLCDYFLVICGDICNRKLTPQPHIPDTGVDN